MLCRFRWVIIHNFGSAKGPKYELLSVVSYVWNEQVRLQLGNVMKLLIPPQPPTPNT